VLLDGAGIGSNGIVFNSGASLNIQDSVIRNFGTGILFEPTASSQLYVSNTLVSDNTNGIYVYNEGPGTTVGGVLDHVATENNANAGILVVNAANFMVRNCTIAGNGTGLATRSGATIRVTRSTITGNGTGWQAASGGSVLSYCDNNIDNNTSVNTAPGGPCPVLPYK